MRSFDTGATRDGESNKLDFEGALSPNVLWAFVSYMDKHRHLPNGSLRDSDNWQLGFPDDVLMKSLLRHTIDLWMLHRGSTPVRPEDGKACTVEDALGAIMFNAQALWHKRLLGTSPDAHD